MIHLDPKEMSSSEIGKYLMGGVAPRPIAFVSTVSKSGVNNVSPFSFFNAFGTNPPAVAFSPARRVRDNTVKDTYNNLIETRECVIQAVTFNMVEQVNLASCEYDGSVDEFEKSGFTPIDSDIVKPKRVKESPFQMECKLIDMINIGTGGGAGNLAICEVLKFHIAEDVIVNGTIEPDRIDLVGRNSGNFYTRAAGEAIFEVEKPGKTLGMGVNALPEYILHSNVYSANNLGRFAMAESIPNNKEINQFINSFAPMVSTEEAFFRFERQNEPDDMLRAAMFLAQSGHRRSLLFYELTAKKYIELGNYGTAWKVAAYKGRRYDSRGI